MEEEGLTLYCRKNLLRASMSICLPSSLICVTGEPRDPVEGWIKVTMLSYCSSLSRLYRERIIVCFCSLSPLGNLRIRLSCCLRRSTTNKVWRLNNLNSNTILENVDLLPDVTVRWRWENEAQLTQSGAAQHFQNALPSGCSLTALPTPSLTVEPGCFQVIMVQMSQSALILGWWRLLGVT